MTELKCFEHDNLTYKNVMSTEYDKTSVNQPSKRQVKSEIYQVPKIFLNKNITNLYFLNNVTNSKRSRNNDFTCMAKDSKKQKKNSFTH